MVHNGADDTALVEPPGVVSGLTQDERIEEFLRLLSAGCTVRQAAAGVALDWSAMYRRRRKDAEFAKRWADAQRVSVEALIAEAERRAMAGSDRLLMFMLTNLAPERFKHRQDVTGTGGFSLLVASGVPESDVDDLL